MIVIVLAAFGGLMIGIIIAIAWTAGCRYGSDHALTAVRDLSRRPNSQA
jgi:hypothetical protein